MGMPDYTPDLLRQWQELAESRKTQIDRLVADRDALRDKVTQLKNALESERCVRRNAQASDAQHTNKLIEYREIARQAKETADRLQKLLNEKRTRISELQVTIAQVCAELSETYRTAEQRGAWLQSMYAERDAMEKERDKYKQLYISSDADRAVLKGDLRALRHRLEASLEKAKADTEYYQEVADAARGNLRELQGKHAALKEQWNRNGENAVDEIHRLEDEAEALKAEVERLRKRLYPGRDIPKHNTEYGPDKARDYLFELAQDWRGAYDKLYLRTHNANGDLLADVLREQISDEREAATQYQQHVLETAMRIDEHITQAAALAAFALFPDEGEHKMEKVNYERTLEAIIAVLGNAYASSDALSY
jgi:hypothetical protein